MVNDETPRFEKGGRPQDRRYLWCRRTWGNEDVLLPVEKVDAQEPEEEQKEGRRRKNPDDGLGHEVAMDVTEDEGEEGR